MKTGNAIVDAIAAIHFEGNIIPHSWYQHELLKGSGGSKHLRKTNLVAVILLAEIIWWYRPRITKDEQTLRIVECKAKFGEHELYIDYTEWAAHLGLTFRQVQDGITFLCERGIIVRTVRRPAIRIYVRPVPAVIVSLNQLSPLQRKPRASRLTK